jgi:hypothetical protein
MFSRRRQFFCATLLSRYQPRVFIMQAYRLRHHNDKHHNRRPARDYRLIAPPVKPDHFRIRGRRSHLQQRPEMISLFQG